MRETLYRGILWVAERIPLRVRAALFELVMRFLWAVDGKHRKIARTNLRIAFPGMEEREAARIVRICYERMGTAAAEFVHFPKMDRAYLETFVRIEGLDHLRKTRCETGLGPLFLTGHFGNWELSSHAYGALVAPIAFIVRPLPDAAWDRIVCERREWNGNRVIRKVNSAKEVMRTLRRGTAVGILVDQNVDRHKGVLVDFFTMKAYTTDGIARMALALRSNIHPVFLFRDPKEKFRHVLRFGPALAMDPDAPRDEEVVRLMRRCNEELENAIREDPSQWLWLQRRWKTRPPGEPDPYGSRG